MIPIYMAFWKRQKYGENKKICGCQGPKRMERDMNGRSTVNLHNGGAHWTYHSV